MMRNIAVVLLFTAALTSLGCASIPGIARKDPSQVSFSEEEKAQLTQMRHGAQKPMPQAGQSVGVIEHAVSAKDEDLNPPVAPDQTRLTVYLNLVQGMIDRNLCYAAIAHLDAMGEQDKRLPEAQFLRAEALRLTRQREAARGVYSTLLGTALAGQARRGLGLLAAEENKLDDAVTHLWQANWLRPTDPKVRNDLGYVLLLRGQLKDAREHLTTALELSRGEGLSTVNMVLLLLIEGQEEAALRLGKGAHLDEASMASLRQQAGELRQRFAQRAPTYIPPIASVGGQATTQSASAPQSPAPAAASISGQAVAQPASVPSSKFQVPSAKPQAQPATSVSGQAVAQPGTVPSAKPPVQPAASTGGQVIAQPASVPSSKFQVPSAKHQAQPATSVSSQAAVQPHPAPATGVSTPPVPAVKTVDQERLVKNSAGPVTPK